ncbi:MAG TPA: hypothetical protein VMR44_09460 [Thermoanaerobaculia bacterium]|nr:hypothetical protein [Thermoanaerobaculia bacterium]
MLTTAAVLFGAGALVGLYMVVRYFQGKGWPIGVALVHGLFGASGLVVLAWAVYQGLGTGGYLTTIALVLFVGAALGGFVLFAAHLRGQAFSRPLVVIHAGVAAVGLVLLLLSL